jgi:murein DD-endopeptidase MepM/ murein hydrolase activator NlpD
MQGVFRQLHPAASRLIWGVSLLLLVACGGQTKAESIGETAAEATHNTLGTTIARQQEVTPGPTATTLVLGGNEADTTSDVTTTDFSPFPTSSFSVETATDEVDFSPFPSATPTDENVPSPTPSPTLEERILNTPTPLPDSTSHPDQASSATPGDEEAILTPAETQVALAEISELAGDHFWLVRPFIGDEEIKDYTEATYRFGSTGNGRYQLHHGVDIGNPQGTPVMATASGTVFFAGDDVTQQRFGPTPNFYGNHIVLEHRVTLPYNNKTFVFYTLYGHLSSIYVQEGEQVNQYQNIGAVGMTGVAIGPHLHLEVRLGNPFDYNAVYNPDLWLQPWFGYGVLVGRVSTSTGELLPEIEVVVEVLPNRNRIYRAFTYADSSLQSDPFFRENFVLPDLPAGTYEVKVGYRGRVAFRQQITIEPERSLYLNVQVQ